MRRSSLVLIVTLALTPPLADAVAGAGDGQAAAGRGGKTTIWDGVYSTEQAGRGEQTYRQACAACHMEDLLGGADVPPLVGEPFFQRWAGSTVDDMLRAMRRTMPLDAPDSLGTQGYVDIIAFVLTANGSPAGSAELPGDRERLQQITITAR